MERMKFYNGCKEHIIYVSQSNHNMNIRSKSRRLMTPGEAKIYAAAAGLTRTKPKGVIIRDSSYDRNR